MVEVIALKGSFTDDEIEKYVDYLQTKYNRKLKSLSVAVCEAEGAEGYVDLKYIFEPVCFERIRRITGYLTGDTKGWNNAKQDELKDRVTHGGMVNL